MSEEARPMAMEIEQKETQRMQLFRVVASLGAGTAAVILVLSVVAGLLVPEFPALYAVPVVATFLVLALFSLWLGRRGYLGWAIGVYLIGMMATVFIAVYLANGVTGPLTVVLIAIPVAAGLLGGRTMVRWISLLVSTHYLAMAVLERLGVLQPGTLFGATTPLAVYAGFLLATLVFTAFLVAAFSTITQRALSVAQRRSLELAETSQRAEQAAQAERAAREREERVARQLRDAVQTYTAFLERVMAGDYDARLPLDETEPAEAGVGELRELGRYLNATVETLIQVLSDLQAVQRRYVREAWDSFAETRGAPLGFRCQQAEIEPTGTAWLPSMAEAVRNQSVATSPRELALPMVLRGEVIGAVGVRRDEETGWSDDDIALAQAIADQLTQTIESLRLLDETQRRAAQERLTGEVTARMRETLDMDAVLQTAVHEISQALGLAALDVRLVAASELTGDTLLE